MSESSYTSKLKKRVLKKYKGAFWFKIPDFFGLDGVKRPFDVMLQHKDCGFVAIEAKHHKTLNPFSFDKVRPHQIENLRKIDDNGGTGFVVVGVQARTTIKTRRELNTNLANIWIDLWIPSSIIPGKKTNMDIGPVNIKEVVRSMKIRGGRFNHRMLCKATLNKFT